MAEANDDLALKQLREKVAHSAFMAIGLSSIYNNISPHWRLFNPISELIQASVTDEKTIPFFLSRIDDKMREMRHQLDISNLNDIIACNVLQMFTDFVKFAKTAPTAAATSSEAHAEIERLKGELFTKTTEVEGFKQDLSRLIQRLDGTFDAKSLHPVVQGASFTCSNGQLALPAPQQFATPPPGTPALRGPNKSTQLVRRTMVEDTRCVTPTATNHPSSLLATKRSVSTPAILSAMAAVPLSFSISSPHPVAPLPAICSFSVPSSAATPALFTPYSSAHAYSVPTSLGPLTPHPAATPRLADMSTDEFLDRVLGPDWKCEPVEESPVQRKRTIEDIIAELVGEEEEMSPKRTRNGKKY